jgi:hypothetical protein
MPVKASPFMKPLAQAASKSAVGFLAMALLLAGSAGLERGHLVANNREHIVNFWRSAFDPSGPWPGMIFVLLPATASAFSAGANHAADRAARALVDEGIHAVEPDVAQVQHIGLVKVDVDVGVGVRGIEVDQVERVAVVPGVQGVGEGDRRQRAGWSGGQVV